MKEGFCSDCGEVMNSLDRICVHREWWLHEEDRWKKRRMDKPMWCWVPAWCLHVEKEE